jgi:plastocyanin
VPSDGIGIDTFSYSPGGYPAEKGVSKRRIRPPLLRSGKSVSFTNLDAFASLSQTQQVWHSVTSCKAPCNRGTGIGYPLANGPIKFDSGQLGFGTGTSSEVTTGSNEFTTPPLTSRGKKHGKTYTYFCRIHPFMRGSVRVKGKK